MAKAILFFVLRQKRKIKMRQLTKNTTIEDIIFDLKDDGQNELAEWLQENYIVNKAINEEAMCQDSYDEGYEIGYDDGYEERL